MRVLWLRPWRRGPLLLLKRPGVALALAAAAFVATLPAAAAPLFLSAARSATLHHRIDSDCPYYVGARISSRLDFRRDAGGPPPTPGSDVFDSRTRMATGAAARVPGLAPDVTTVWATAATTLPDSDLPLRLASRTDFALHVQAIAGPDGAGVWIPDSLVELTGLRVGDRLRLVNGPAAAPPPRVAAVYHDLRGAPDQRYWCSVTYLYRGLPGEGNLVPVPPLVLMDSGPMLNTLSALNMTGTHIIEYPIADNRLTQPDAARMGAAVARMRTGLYEADPPVFRSDYTANTQFQSNIGAFADRADLVRRGLLPPVVPITGAGVLVGLLVVAAAALFWVREVVSDR